MRSLISKQEAKQIVLDCRKEGEKDIDILPKLHLMYASRYMGMKELKAAVKELGWRVLSGTEHMTMDGIYQLGFKPPKRVLEELGLEDDAFLTIGYSPEKPKEPFEELN